MYRSKPGRRERERERGEKKRQYLTKGQSGRLEAIIVDQVRSHSAVTQPAGRVGGVPVCPDDERGHFLIRAANSEYGDASTLSR